MASNGSRRSRRFQLESRMMSCLRRLQDLPNIVRKARASPLPESDPRTLCRHDALLTGACGKWPCR